MIEPWIEMRCVACIPLGYDTARLILRLRSVSALEIQELRLQFFCPRCKSWLEWQVGAPDFVISIPGMKNKRHTRIAFE